MLLIEIFYRFLFIIKITLKTEYNVKCCILKFRYPYYFFYCLSFIYFYNIWLTIPSLVKIICNVIIFVNNANKAEFYFASNFLSLS